MSSPLPLKKDDRNSRQYLDEAGQMWSWIAIAGMCGVTIYAYFNSLRAVAETWTSAQYSHGYLIPLFAAVLLWMRREQFEEVPARQRWWGVAIVASGILLRVVSAYYTTNSSDRVSFLVCLVGIFTIVGGWRALKWAGPPIAFMAFMFPWPSFMVNLIMRRLKTWATEWSVFALQTLGVEGFNKGNIIFLNNGTSTGMELGVVDACSGLRMLTIFLALATAVAMVATNRPWWERGIIVLSAIPIAVAVNIVRITITGLLHSFGFPESVGEFFHDTLAAYVMMPLALGMLYLEYQVLSHLVIDADDHLPTAGIAR